MHVWDSCMNLEAQKHPVPAPLVHADDITYDADDSYVVNEELSVSEGVRAEERNGAASCTVSYSGLYHKPQIVRFTDLSGKNAALRRNLA